MTRKPILSHPTRYDFRGRVCPCGSGEQRRELKDAAGIFCAFVCDKCEPTKRAKFDPAIFDGRSAYASTGDERDVGRYSGEDY